MARLTAKQALRNVLASGWVSDALAKDTATQELIERNGDDEAKARLAVEKAFVEVFASLGGG